MTLRHGKAQRLEKLELASYSIRLIYQLTKLVTAQ